MRFQTSQLVDPKSAYVSAPWEAMAAKLGQQQQLQDQYKTQISVLDQPVNSLTNDTENLLKKKTEVEQKLDDLRKLDYNDPQSRDSIYSTIKDVRNEYSPQGELGMYQAKYNQFADEYKNIQEIGKKDPSKATYLKYQLMQEAQSPDKAIQKDANGEYINTTVTPPKDFNWKDPNEEYSKALKDVAYDTTALGPGWGYTPIDTVRMYQDGSMDKLSRAKLDKAIAMRFSSDLDLMQSVRAQAFNNGIDPNSQDNFYSVNPDGSIQFDTNTILGRIAEGGNQGAAFTRTKIDYHTVTDQTAIDKAKYDIEHPPVILTGKAMEDLRYGTKFADSTSINTSLTNTADNIKNEFIQLEVAQGKTLANATADANNPAMTVDAMISYAKQYPDKKLTPRMNGLIDDYQLTQRLDQEAEQVALKQVGIKPPTLTMVKPLNGLSVDETAFAWGYGDTRNAVGKTISLEDSNKLLQIWQKVIKDDPNTAGDESKPSTYNDGRLTAASQQYLHNQIAKQNSNIGVQQLDASTKYFDSKNTAKENYLKDNSQQRLKENIALNKNVVLMDQPVFDAAGKPVIDPSTGRQMTRVVEDTTSTTAINNQINSNFATGQYDNVPTTISNPDIPGTFYTLGEYKQMKLASVSGDTGKTAQMLADFKNMKPWYSSYPEVSDDGTIQKPMYVNVGGESVKMNQSKLSVNYGQGLVPISSLNSTPSAQTETYLANVAAHGVHSVEQTTADGTVVQINNAKTAQNYANGSTLQLVFIAPDGTKEVATGQEAFDKITALRTNGILK